MITSIRLAFAARIEAVRGLRHATAEAADLGGVDLDSLGRPDTGIVSSWHADQAVPPIMAPSGFVAERRGSVVRYWPSQNPDRKGRPAMVDDGAIIWVEDESDRTVDAALTLARRRFGNVAVFGDDAYIGQCREAAERLGIEIEVITIEEVHRRASRVRSGRTEARRRVLEQGADTGADRRDVAGQRRRAWARAYARATSEEGLPGSSDEPGRIGIPHHLDIPVEASSADAAKPEIRQQRPMVRSPKTSTRSRPRHGGIDR